MSTPNLCRGRVTRDGLVGSTNQHGISSFPSQPAIWRSRFIPLFFDSLAYLLQWLLVCCYLESLYFYHMLPPRQLLLLLHLEVIAGKCSRTENCCCLSFLGLGSSLCFSTQRPKLSIEKGALNETS